VVAVAVAGLDTNNYSQSHRIGVVAIPFYRIFTGIGRLTLITCSFSIQGAFS